MKISVTGDAGEEMFSYDTNKDSNCLHPSQAETPAVIEALTEARRFLSGNPSIARTADRT
jgi:hypothetical protein